MIGNNKRENKSPKSKRLEFSRHEGPDVTRTGNQNTPLSLRPDIGKPMLVIIPGVDHSTDGHRTAPCPPLHVVFTLLQPKPLIYGDISAQSAAISYLVSPCVRLRLLPAAGCSGTGTPDVGVGPESLLLFTVRFTRFGRLWWDLGEWGQVGEFGVVDMYVTCKDQGGGRRRGERVGVWGCVLTSWRDSRVTVVYGLHSLKPYWTGIQIMDQ